MIPAFATATVAFACVFHLELDAYVRGRMARRAARLARETPSPAAGATGADAARPLAAPGAPPVGALGAGCGASMRGASIRDASTAGRRALPVVNTHASPSTAVTNAANAAAAAARGAVAAATARTARAAPTLLPRELAPPRSFQTGSPADSAIASPTHSGGGWRAGARGSGGRVRGRSGRGRRDSFTRSWASDEDGGDPRRSGSRSRSSSRSRSRNRSPELSCAWRVGDGVGSQRAFGLDWGCREGGGMAAGDGGGVAVVRFAAQRRRRAPASFGLAFALAPPLAQPFALPLALPRHSRVHRARLSFRDAADALIARRVVRRRCAASLWG